MFNNKAIFKDEIVLTDNGIWEVKGLAPGEYDDRARAYDKLISNPIYNHIMWGSSPKDYKAFAQESLNNAKSGLIIDIGCGTLGFTSEVYSNYDSQDLILSDLSKEMLKLGADKLKREKSEHKIHFLRADAFNMPFKNNTVDSILSFGIFHIFDDRKRLLSEYQRILKERGKLFLSSLCTDRKFSALYLKLLHNKNHVAQALSSSEIKSLIEESGFNITQQSLKGSMVFIAARRQ